MHNSENEVASAFNEFEKLWIEFLKNLQRMLGQAITSLSNKSKYTTTCELKERIFCSYFGLNFLQW